MVTAVAVAAVTGVLVAPASPAASAAAPAVARSPIRLQIPLLTTTEGSVYVRWSLDDCAPLPIDHLPALSVCELGCDHEHEDAEEAPERVLRERARDLDAGLDTGDRRETEDDGG